MKRYNFVVGIAVSLIVLFIYRHWFSTIVLSAGDWSFHFPEEVMRFFLLPSSWVFWLKGGLGGNGVFITGLETYFSATARLFYTFTGMPWAISERVIWYFPFLIIGVYSSLKLVCTVSSDDGYWWITPLIFLTNTYILMVTDGGQMGVAMAYAIAPLVLSQFITLQRSVSAEKSNLRKTYRQVIITGLALSLMVLFDPRLAYILVLAVIIYWFVAVLIGQEFSARLPYFFIIPFLIMILFHLFWLLPLVIFRVSPIASLGGTYSSLASVKFFSFTDFSHALALLHPNWPENIFGKVYFLQPEFLVIPLLVFIPLLFTTKQNKHSYSVIISSALMGLTGAYLAKGTNDPGGGVYLWLFSHLPGFNVFRDPAKFYLLTALSYSILISISLNYISKFFRKIKWFKTVLVILFVLFWLFTLRQAVFGQLKGTFRTHMVPTEYETLKNFINQPEFFRTFWLPHAQRYGLSTYMHPALDSMIVLNTSSASGMLRWLDTKEGIDELSRWSVKFVILPYDSQQEIFLDDRKYSEKLRLGFKNALDKNNYLTKVTVNGLSDRISVYHVPKFKDHLSLESANPESKLSWRMEFPTDYSLRISGLNSPALIIFSEAYDSNWQILVNGKVIKSKPTSDKLNSFRIPADTKGIVKMEYAPQKYLEYGSVVSLISLIAVIGFLVLLKAKQ